MMAVVGLPAVVRRLPTGWEDVTGRETRTPMGTSTRNMCVWVCGRGCPWGLSANRVLVGAAGLAGGERGRDEDVRAGLIAIAKTVKL